MNSPSFYISYWKYNSPVKPHVRLLVGWLVSGLHFHTPIGAIVLMCNTGKSEWTIGHHIRIKNMIIFLGISFCFFNSFPLREKIGQGI